MKRKRQHPLNPDFFSTSDTPFDIFSGANWARHGGKRRLMAPEGQFMAENDSSRGSLTERQGKNFLNPQWLKILQPIKWPVLRFGRKTLVL